MSGLEWYPRHSRKALDGMRSLTLEQRGAYNTLLDLIYDRGEAVPDDDRWLAGQMGVSVRKWLIIRAALLDAGRIVARQDRKGPTLSDEVAETEIEKQSLRRRTNAESGKLGGEKSAKRRAEPSKIIDLTQANATPTAQPPLKLVRETEEYSVPNGTGAVRPVDDVLDQAKHTPPLAQPEPPPDPSAEAWRRGPAVVRTNGRCSDANARKFFGQLLKEFSLEPRDLLPSIVACEAKGTQDPQGYLRRAARAVAERRGPIAETAESRVASWGLDEWRAAVGMYRDEGRWGAACGPKPDEDGCRAPQSVLAEMGFSKGRAA